MSENLRRIDKYLRREDTRLAQGLRKISPKTGPEYLNSRTKKRIDKILALSAAIATTPIMGAVALAIKLEDGGDIFYSTTRVGRRGEPVKIVKFRSLREGADKDTQANDCNARSLGNRDDPRSTKIGRFIRRTNLDELPQLWQAAKGDIALFGMRANSALTFEIMDSDRPEDSTAYRELYEQFSPGIINPNTTLVRDGGSNSRLHSNAFYAKKASLGTDIYMIYRGLTKRSLYKKKG